MNRYKITYTSATDSSTITEHHVTDDSLETVTSKMIARFGDRLVSIYQNSETPNTEDTTPKGIPFFNKINKIISNIQRRYAEKKIGELTDTINDFLNVGFKFHHESLSISQNVVSHILNDVKSNPEVYANILSKVMNSGKRIAHELTIVTKEVKSTLKIHEDHFTNLTSELSKMTSSYASTFETLNEEANNIGAKLSNLTE